VPPTNASTKRQVVIPTELRRLGIMRGAVARMEVERKSIRMVKERDDALEAMCGILAAGSCLTEALLRERLRQAGQGAAPSVGCEPDRSLLQPGGGRGLEGRGEITRGRPAG